MQMKNSLRAGFTLVEIMIVVAIIGLLAAIAIPNFVKARQASQRTACISNLRAIDGAKTTWSLDQRKGGSDAPSDADIFGQANYIKDKPACPSNGTYSLNAVDAKATCTVPDHTY